MPANAVTTLHAPWADAGPAESAPHVLALPSVEAGLAYRWHWWRAAVPGLLARHRLQPRANVAYAAPFSAGQALRERYAELFDLRHGPAGADYPFLHAQSVITLLHGRVFADLGVNRRHVLPLRHRTRLLAGAAAGLAAAAQQLACRLLRVVRVAPTEVLVLIETRIGDADGKAVAVVEDGFLVRELAVADAVQADEDDLLRRAVSRTRRRNPEIDGRLAGVRVRQLYIAPDAGRRFGRVSGEISPLHATRWGARLFGQRRPFVQAMYLRHLVTREIVEWGLLRDTLQISFTRKACFGQTLRLLQQGDVFELVDDHGHLVAFGKS